MKGETQPFEVEVCVDTSHVNVVDRDGAPMVAQGNPTHILYSFTVADVGGTLRAVGQQPVATSC